MQDPLFILILAAASLAGLAMVTLAGLRGWNGWLDLKRAEIGQGRMQDATPPSAAARIEVADLKERIRRLEAIAAGVDP